MLKFSLLRSLKITHNCHKPHLRFTISAHFSSSSSVDDSAQISTTDYLTRQHKFSQETALKVCKSVPYIKNSESSNSVLSFFKDIGFSKTHVEDVVKGFPRILLSDPETTLKPKIELFRELGFSNDDIAEIVSGDPWVLVRSLNNTIVPSIVALKEVLGSTRTVIKLLKLSGWFLKANLEKTMLPNIEYLKSCGISLEQIVRYVTSFPRFFLYKPEMMECFVTRTDKWGVSRSSKMFLPAMRVLSSMSNEKWESKLQVFRDLGFSEHDIVDVFRRVPLVFALSEEKIKSGVEALLSVRNNNISFVVRYPQLLIYSVEGRLKPRLRVLKILEEKNLLKYEVSLTSVCRIPDKQFLERYVTPFADELGGAYMVRKI